jgi:hypothetical protein
VALTNGRWAIKSWVGRLSLICSFVMAGFAQAQAWASERGEAGSGEQWTAPAGGTMFGVGRTVRGGTTVEYEFMQIRVGTDGKLVFIALPSGQRETSFALTSAGEREVAFENPQHDFPTRVSYRLQADDRLVARIEGQRDGKPRGIEYVFKRVACPGSR